MGSLIVMDVLHIPYGCSVRSITVLLWDYTHVVYVQVWPAFWTYGIEKEWPEAGEIDIIEAINDMERNQIALHTIPGCSKADTLPQSGRTLETDCSTNRGCIVAESKPNSFGPGFSEAGGGVYALLIEPTNINVWFFSVSASRQPRRFHSRPTLASGCPLQHSERYENVISRYRIVGNPDSGLPTDTL
jgi:hypothetical protein